MLAPKPGSSNGKALVLQTRDEGSIPSPGTISGVSCDCVHGCTSTPGLSGGTKFGVGAGGHPSSDSTHEGAALGARVSMEEPPFVRASGDRMQTVSNEAVNLGLGGSTPLGHPNRATRGRNAVTSSGACCKGSILALEASKSGFKSRGPNHPLQGKALQGAYIQATVGTMVWSGGTWKMGETSVRLRHVGLVGTPIWWSAQRLWHQIGLRFV